MAAQLRHVGPRQQGVQRALPAPPIAGARQQRAAGLRLDGEPAAPVGRRRGVQPQLVPTAAVAKQQLHVVQLQRRRGALLVDPAQGAAADQKFMLFEKPVGRGAAVDRRAGVGAGQVQPADEPAALHVAPHLQPGAVDQQLAEAQPQRQQRGHRQRCRHLRQAQRLAARGVAQHHVAQREGRHPAAALHGDLADVDRMPQRPGGLCLDLRAPVVQTRQNPPMQREPGHQTQAPCRQQQPPGDAPGPVPGASPITTVARSGPLANRSDE